MSDVKRYTFQHLERKEGLMKRQVGQFVAVADFDAEHAIRLEAERQVGELREQFVTQRNHFREQLRDAKKADALQASLDKALELLRGCHTGELFGPDDWETVNAFLNTTSTEGKAVECGQCNGSLVETLPDEDGVCRDQKCTQCTEGKDHE